MRKIADQVLSCPSSASTAWTSNAGQWTYASLALEVEALKRTVNWPEHGTAVLTAEPTFAFLATFLALLEMGQAQAILPAGVSREDRSQYAQMLGSAYIVDHDNSVVWINEAQESHIALETVLILFTSGSAGKPKGVQLSHNNIVAASDAICDTLDFKSVSQQWLMLNLHYSFGLLGQLLPAIRTGAHTRRVGHILELVRALHDGELSGMISGVPSQLLTLCQLLKNTNKVAEGVTHVVTAGAAASPALRKQMCEVFPSAVIYVNYGQTEASPRILSINSRDQYFHSTATGYPVGNLKTMIASDGELLVSGDQIMQGYLGGAPNVVINDWLHTGDLASMGKGGLITVQGRKDSVVKIAGNKVALLEVENTLCKLAGVKGVLVSPVECERYGYRLYALLEVDIDAEGESLCYAKLVKTLSTTLEPYSIPERFYRVQSLPLNSNGKLDRTQARKYFQESQRIL